MKRCFVYTDIIEFVSILDFRWPLAVSSFPYPLHVEASPVLSAALPIAEEHYLITGSLLAFSTRSRFISQRRHNRICRYASDCCFAAAAVVVVVIVVVAVPLH